MRSPARRGCRHDRGLADVERDRVAAVRQRLRVGGQPQQQRHDREALLAGGSCSLSSADSVSRSSTSRCMLRACSCISCEVARALALVELEVLHRLDEAADHGQRCLELVRDVGDEVAPHARDRLELRDVARQQQRSRRCRTARAEATACAALADRRSTTIDSRVVAGLDVGEELGLAHEVHDRLAAILRGIEAELRSRARGFAQSIAIARVEHDMPSGIASAALRKRSMRVAQVALRAPCASARDGGSR